MTFALVSRLKGMETNRVQSHDRQKIPTRFGYAFPFEGNGNACLTERDRQVSFLVLCIPV